MPRVAKGPWKWAIFYTHTPLLLGRRGEEYVNLRTFIYGWWSLDAWSDREYCALYDTKEEAEKDKAWIVKGDEDTWQGIVHVAPTKRRLGEERVVSEIRAKQAREEAEKKEADARFEKWYLEEKARLDNFFKKSR